MSSTGLSFKVEYNKHLSKLVDKFTKFYPELVERAVRVTASFALKSIVLFTPVKTGAARASWVTEQVDPYTYNVVSSLGRGAKYTPDLEYGTGIWRENGAPITPKRGEFLIFPIIEGNTIVRWVKTRSVNGMMGHFMVTRTKKPATEKLVKTLKNAIRAEWGKR